MYLSRIKRSLFLLISASSAVLMSLNPSFAREITIQVWAGGSNVNDAYRVDAIVMAADILEKEAVIRGENLNITVETKYDFDGWGGFKQAVTLAQHSLNRNGCLYLEINPKFKENLLGFIKSKTFKDIEVRNDIFGKERMLKAVKS